VISNAGTCQEIVAGSGAVLELHCFCILGNRCGSSSLSPIEIIVNAFTEPLSIYTKVDKAVHHHVGQTNSPSRGSSIETARQRSTEMVMSKFPFGNFKKRKYMTIIAIRINLAKNAVAVH
jgi:hypothetical protein